MKNKRGDSGGTSVAVLISLIGLFVLLFVLMLPPEERENLLGNQTNSYGDNNDNGVNGVERSTLLLESPGTVYPNKKEEIDHKLNPINIFIRNEPKIITLVNSLEVSKGLFSGQDQNINFNVDDLNNLEDVILNFVVRDPKGKLIVELNGNVVLNSEVNAGVKLIQLPISYLRRINKLDIHVSGPGISFFTVNHYTLEDVRVKQEFEVENSKETRTFTVSDKEKDSLKGSKLSYFFYCNDLDLTNAMFTLYLNDKKLDEYPQAIRCSSGEREIELNENEIKEGTNKLVFMIDEGDFSFSQIVINDKLSEKMFPLYYFFIDSNDFDKIENGDYGVILKLSLKDNDKTKRAEIKLNDETMHIDTRQDSYSRDITGIVESGENLIKITPINEFDIDRLKISIEES